MSTDCSPAGCARIVSSARSASSARTNTTTRPSLATSSGSSPRNAQAARTSSATGTEDSTICTTTPAASAISLSVAATPPRVGSRIMDTSAPESSSAAMTPLSGWLSVTMSDPNSSPSRTLSTAMPCAAIGPETRILSPGRTCCGPSSKPGRTNPMPAVLMYTPSPLPESTTFVSPVTIDTPAVRAAAPIVSAMTPSSSSGMPSSRISPTESAKGVAPLTARSLTVPLIARSPTLPPGKKRGRTTYESVLNASFIPAMSSTAESPSCCRTPANSVPLNDGTNSAEISSADNRPPPPCPMTIEVWSRSGNGQVQFSRSGRSVTR